MRKLYKHKQFTQWTPWLTAEAGQNEYLGTKEANELEYYLFRLWEQLSEDCRHKSVSDVLEDETLHWQLIEHAEFCYENVKQIIGDAIVTTSEILLELHDLCQNSEILSRIILEAMIGRERITLIDIWRLVDEPRDDQESFTIKWQLK
jgi:hypothetical protein